MDFFVFDSVTSDGYISGGRALNGIRTAMWAERYQEPGEFEFKSPISAQLKTVAPTGSLISHVETKEVMYVASHEIDENVKDREPDLITKGYSLDHWLKNRITGSDFETYVISGHRLYVNNDVYTLAFDTSWAQAVQLITDFFNSNFNIPNDNIAGFVPISNQQHIQPFPVDPVARTMRKENVHAALMELLAVDDFGIKIMRPNSSNVDPTSTEFRIHNGNDKRDTVIFSHAYGDLLNSRYFWSEESEKTDYICFSTYFRLRSDNTAVGFNRKCVLVDCTDMDGHLSDDDVVDSGITDFIGDWMDARGQATIRAQNAKSLLSTDISKTTRYKFRTDYDVGDIVTVRGNYDVSSDMRVTEHVEFQDENGESGYPTLSAVYE